MVIVLCLQLASVACAKRVVFWELDFNKVETGVVGWRKESLGVMTRGNLRVTLRF